MLTITVTQGNYSATAEFWPAVQHMIGAVSGLGTGQLTRIRRPDQTCNYRAPGDYELTYVPVHGDAIDVRLNLE